MHFGIEIGRTFSDSSPPSPGQAVSVRWNPNDPNDSVLQPGIDGPDLFFLTMITPFNAVMLAGWIAHVRIRRTGSVLDSRFHDDGIIARAGVDTLPPEMAATIAAGCTAFALSFLVGIPAGRQMTISIGSGTGLAVVVVAGIAWWRTVASRHAGASDVIVNRDSLTVTLPKTRTRRAPLTVAWANVADVDEFKCPGDLESYSVRLTFRQPIEGTETCNVIESTTQKTAHRVREWLRELLAR